MRTKFAILLAIIAVCVTTAWAGWSNEEQLTSNRYSNGLRWSCGHRTVVAPNGVRHLVWYANSTVYYKRYYPSSGWTPDYQLTTIKNSAYPSIALDSNGTDIHVTWSGDGGSKKQVSSHVYYQKCVPGSSGNGGWVGTPTDLTPNAAGTSYYASSVASFRDQAQVVHVVATWFDWSHLNSIGFRECVGGNWGNTAYFTYPSVPGHTPTLGTPSIAVDAQNRYGDVFLLYSVLDPEYLLVVRRQGGVWQDPECVAAGYWSFASVEVDPTTGYPHVVCRAGNTYHVHHSYWDPDLSGWQTLEMISDPSAPWSTHPNMFYSGGSFFVVWAESSSVSERGIRYSTGQYGNWTTPAWVTSGYHDEFPSVAARSNGDVYVVWEDGRGRTPQIWGRLYTPGSGGGQAQPTALSQSRIELFPNPAKAGRVTVQYSLPCVEQMRVTLLDVSGRAVRTQEVAAAGLRGSFTIDVSGLTAGVYVARLVAGDLNVSKSLVVQR